LSARTSCSSPRLDDLPRDPRSRRPPLDAPRRQLTTLDDALEGQHAHHVASLHVAAPVVEHDHAVGDTLVFQCDRASCEWGLASARSIGIGWTFAPAMPQQRVAHHRVDGARCGAARAVDGGWAESRQQIGWVLVGGMSLGTILTIFVVPTVYTLMALKRVPGGDRGGGGCIRRSSCGGLAAATAVRTPVEDRAAIAPGAMPQGLMVGRSPRRARRLHCGARDAGVRSQLAALTSFAALGQATGSQITRLASLAPLRPCAPRRPTNRPCGMAPGAIGNHGARR
jgi:hypothetical protein